MARFHKRFFAQKLEVAFLAIVVLADVAKHRPLGPWGTFIVFVAEGTDGCPRVVDSKGLHERGKPPFVALGVGSGFGLLLGPRLGWMPLCGHTV